MPKCRRATAIAGNFGPVVTTYQCRGRSGNGIAVGFYTGQPVDFKRCFERDLPRNFRNGLFGNITD